MNEAPQFSMLKNLGENVIPFQYKIETTTYVGYRSIRPESPWGAYALREFVDENWVRFSNDNRRLVIAIPAKQVLFKKTELFLGNHAIYELPGLEAPLVAYFSGFRGFKNRVLVSNIFRSVYDVVKFEIIFADSVGLLGNFSGTIDPDLSRRIATMLKQAKKGGANLADMVFNERKFKL